MNASHVNEVARAMAVDEVDSLDPEDKFKLSLQEKFAVHRALHGEAIAGAHPEFYMAVAKARRRLVVHVENKGERLLVDVEQLYEHARRLGTLDDAFRHAFETRCAGHVVEGPFRCNFAYAHWAEGPMD
jgi:hypothetical protein